MSGVRSVGRSIVCDNFYIFFLNCIKKLFSVNDFSRGTGESDVRKQFLFSVHREAGLQDSPHQRHRVHPGTRQAERQPVNVGRCL